MEKGDTVKGKVVKIVKYGAFVELDNGSEGLVHISQISHDYVKNVEDYLKVGDELEVKVVGKNDRGLYELSLKALEEKPSSKSRIKKDASPGFEKMLKDYLRKSEESHGILKRRREEKK